MIQFNLLPDVKLEYIKARRTQRTIITSSVVVSGAAIALFVLLFLVVNVVQKNHLSSIDADIKASKNELKSKQDLSKILTIQNQLKSLPALHADKPVASRALGYIQQVTPQSSSVSSLVLNFTEKTIKIEGSADSLATVNTFVDTLKFTSYTATSVDTPEANPESVLAFKSVVLTSFAVASGNTKDKNKAATYSITLSYEPDIFQSNKTISLQVAKKITTRSETQKPSAVFQAKPAEVNLEGIN